MIEAKTEKGRTEISAKGSTGDLMAEMGVMVSAIVETILRDYDSDDVRNNICTAMNLIMIRSVQNARERVTKHDG